MNSIENSVLQKAFDEACQNYVGACFEKRGNKEVFIEYADRNDSIDNESLQKILRADDPVMEFEDLVAIWYEQYELTCRWDVAEAMVKIFGIKNIEATADEIYDRLTGDESYTDDNPGFESDYSDVIDHIKRQMVHTVVSLDCGEAAGWFYKSEGVPFDERHWPAAFLLKKLGATEKSMKWELENTTSNINATILLCDLSVGQLIEIAASRKDMSEKTFAGIKFQQSTMAGFFDNVNGGGSVLEFEFKSDFTVPADAMYTILPDGKNKFTPDWSVDSVYGLVGSAWKEAEPVWKKKM